MKTEVLETDTSDHHKMLKDHLKPFTSKVTKTLVNIFQ